MSTETKLIGYYKKRTSTDGVDITIEEFFDGIATGRWQRYVEWVREADVDAPRVLDEQTKRTLNEYDRRKEQAPCVTVAGTFEGAKTKENLRQPSGLMAIDLDKLSDRLTWIRQQLAQDSFVHAQFKSIGGQGLCVIFRINPDRWEDSFDGLADYLISTYGLVTRQFDKSSRNVNRLRYVSYDPEIYVNQKAKLFTKYPPKKPKTKPKAFVHTQDDIEFVIQQVEEQGIEFHDTNGDWVRAGLALASKYDADGRDYFQRISQFRHDYGPDKTDQVYAYLCKNKRGDVTIATFYFLCRQAGLDIMTPRTKEVVSVAAMAKRQKITKSSTLAMVLKQFPDVTQEQAEPIIEQVYAATEPFDTQETLFDQLELFLKTNYQLRLNEITHYIEDGDRVLLDKQLNSVYIHAAKTFDMKVTKDMVFTLLFSEFVQAYHPIKSFINDNKHRKPFGVIDALADTITHDMGTTNYVHFFLRKCLVGMIGLIFGKQCPLVPILTGPPNTGKTQFWRRLLPDELKAYYAECKFTKEGDDEMLMCKRWLLMNDDFDNVFLQKHARFKSLTDKHTLTVRKPYGKAHEDILRLALIAGTSNEEKLLSDATGNRRIIPISVLRIDHQAYNAIDKTDLLMEAYWAYMGGETGDLTNEQIVFLEKHTGRYVDVSTEHDIVDKYFQIPTIKEDAMLWSQGEILVYLSQITGLKNLKPKLISQEMKAMGFPYSDKEWYKPEGKAKRGFYLYKRTDIDGSL